MKKILFTAALAIFTASASMAQTAVPVVISDAAAKTEALSMKETEYDFGKIPQGKPVTHVFEVSNTGKTAFKLENVVAGCGCTTPVWDKEASINPGQKANITVGFNAAAEGPFTKPVTITYNGGQTKVINIKGEVWATPATAAPENTGANQLKN